MLEQWVRSEHLDPDRLAADAEARPLIRYVVVDQLFTQHALEQIAEEFRAAHFEPDNPGVNYDSLGCAIRRGGELGRLLRDETWIHFVHSALGLPFVPVAKNVTALRLHAPDARGFWPHRDDLPSDPKRIAVLLYLTEEWRPSDGGVLQLWTEQEERITGEACLRWTDWLDRRLSFLDSSTTLQVELGGPSERPLAALRLVDTIAPLYNRAVFLALRPGPAIHSVTPSNRGNRKALLQWLT